VVDLLAGSPGLLIGVCLLLGLLVGSFLNVVVHRVPLMMQREWAAQCEELAGREPAPQPRYNLITPRSACPKCCHADRRGAEHPGAVSWLLAARPLRRTAARRSARATRWSRR
jgi:leader peptidase (prepilin peptidase) / N-methyltransferase